MGAGDGATDPENVSFALYVQSPVAGTKTETIDRLNALDVAGAIASFDVRTVREEFIVSQRQNRTTADIPGELVEAVEWCGTELSPAFGTEKVRTRLGRTVQRLSPPETVLVVYVDRELVCVFPCTDGTRTWTVEDFLDSYETSREPPARIDIDLRVP